MRFNTFLKPSVFAMTALAASISSVVHAQSSDGFMLEEIVVTATKRETDLMDTGIAVSAYDSSALQKLNITNSQDVAANTPSMTVNDTGVNIRGIGRTSQNVGTEPGVGIYVNGVYTSEMQLLEASDFFDVSQVEVLRGPQGTLFGKSTVGGAVSVTHNRASEETEGRLRVDYGSEGAQVVQGMFNTALSDKFAARVTFSDKTRDELQKNSGGGDLEGVNARYASLSLAAQWTDSFESHLRVEHLRSDQRPGSFFVDSYKTKTSINMADGLGGLGEWFSVPPIASVNYPGIPMAVPASTLVNPTATDLGKVRRDFEGKEINEYSAATLVNEWAMDKHDLKFTAYYGQSHYHRETDADGTVMADQPLMILGSPALGSDYRFDVVRNARVHNYELQLTSNYDGAFNYVTGANFYQWKGGDSGKGFYDKNFDFRTVNGGFGGFALVELAPSFYDYIPVVLNGYSADYADTVYSQKSYLEDTSTAVFAQGTYDLNEDLTLTLGARYTDNEKVGQDSNYLAFTTGCEYNGVIADPFGPLTVYGVALEQTNCKPAAHAKTQSWQETTWRVQMDWAVTDDSLIYGSVATGFKPGVLRLGENYTDDPTAVEEVQPETIVSYELGYKGEFLDNRLRIGASLYHYTWKDMQVNVSRQAGNVNVTSYENAAKSKATGFELESTYLITENWMVAGSYSYIDSEYEEFNSVDTAACNSLKFDNFLTGAAVDTTAACATQNLAGNKLSGMPENKYAVRTSYTIPAESGDFVVDASWMFVGSQYHDAANSEARKTPGWHRADASIAWFGNNTDVSVKAYVKNITDDRQLLGLGSINSQDGGQTAAATLPRMYGVQVDYRF